MLLKLFKNVIKQNFHDFHKKFCCPKILPKIWPKSFCDVAATSPYGPHISITVVMAQEQGYGGKGIGTKAYRQGYKGKALRQDITAMA